MSWQIVPKRSVELLTGPSAAKVWPALMKMNKIRHRLARGCDRGNLTVSARKTAPIRVAR